MQLASLVKIMHVRVLFICYLVRFLNIASATVRRNFDPVLHKCNDNFSNCQRHINLSLDCLYCDLWCRVKRVTGERSSLTGINLFCHVPQCTKFFLFLARAIFIEPTPCTKYFDFVMLAVTFVR